MRPLSIVHALPLFDPTTRLGESMVHLRRLARALTQRGHKVSVVTTDLGMGLTTPRDQWVERDGFRIWYARAHRFGKVAPYYCPRVAAVLDEALRNADLLHLTLSFTHFNILGREAAQRMNVPYVYSPHMCLDPARLRQRRLSKSVFLALYERAIIRDAAVIQVTTETERTHVVRQGARPEHCILIPSGADLDRDTILPEGAIFRKHFQVHKDAPLVFCLARHQPFKAMEMLLAAFGRVVAATPAARLVVAGHDERMRGALEKRADRLGIPQALLLIGRIEGNLRLAAFRAADVFALPSWPEGVPGSVLEACAAGTPVLLTDRCNFPEVAACGAGRVVSADPEVLAGALREMLADRKQLRAMGEAGRRMVSERFAFSTVVDQVEQMYQGLVAARSGAATTRAA